MVMAQSTINQELVCLSRRMPNFAEILSKAAREGRMSGYTPMTEITWPAGTIYTHLARGNVMHAIALAHEIRLELGQSEWVLTPLQNLLWVVRSGDKPATSEPLKQFVDLLKPYLLYRDVKPVQAEQQSLW